MSKIQELLSEIMENVNNVQNKYLVRTIKFSDYKYELSCKDDKKCNNSIIELSLRKNNEYYILREHIWGDLLYFTVDENEETINFRGWISLKKNSVTEEQAIMLCEEIENMTKIKIK